MKTNTQQRIDLSFKFVAHGFTLVATHPILFVYSLIFLSIPAVIAISRFFNIPETHDPAYAYHLITHANSPESLIAIALTLGFFILMTFVAASVTIHTSGLLRHKKVSVRATLRSLIHHASHLILWGIVSTVIIYSGLALLHVASMAFKEERWPYYLLSTLRFMVSTIWSFAIFFMIQIDSLENFGLFESFKRSCVLGARRALEILMVKIAYNITLFMFGVFLIPLVMILSPLFALADNYQLLLEGILGSALMMIFFTVYIVFSTQLYNQHYNEVLD